MKKYLILFSVMFILAATIGFFYFNKENFSKIELPKERVQHLYGIGTTENADAYKEYEFMRLHNPVTGEIPKDYRKRELEFWEKLPRNQNRSNVWQSRGPNNVGGRTRALALDITNENSIIAGQVSGGMWRSVDGGEHFVKTTAPHQIHSVTCVAQDTRPGKTNVWYYGTGEHYGIVNAAGFSSRFSGDGIFKSTDGGESWEQLLSTVSSTPTTLYQKRDFDFVWEIVTEPVNVNEDVVYAAVVNGVWRSADGGITWQAVLGLDTTVNPISEYTDIAISSTGILYATVSSETPSKGIWRSVDGIIWVNITPQGFPANYRRIEIAIAPSDESQVWFIAETPGSGATGHHLWKYRHLSGDGTGTGGDWSNKTANIPNDNCTGFYTFDFAKFSSQNSYDLCIAVKPDDPDVVFLGGTNLYRSMNGYSSYGYAWIGGYQCDTAKISNYIYPNHHPDQHKLIFLPSNPNIAISASDGGIMRTENILADTVVWRSLNNGYNTGQFYTCAIERGETDSEIMIGGLQDNGTFFTNSLNYLQGWKSIFYGDGAYCAITRNRSNYYLSWQTGKTFKFDISDDGTVNNLTRIDPTGGGSGYLFINPFILDPTADSILYLPAGRSIWRNDNLNDIPLLGDEYNTISTNWVRLNGTILNFSGNTIPSITTLALSEANPHRLFFGTSNGRLFKLDSCRTNNTQRVDISGVQFPSNAYLSCVDADRLNPDVLLISFSNYGVPSIFYTEDGGANWTDVSGNLEENSDGSGNGPSVPWVHLFNDGNQVTYFAGTSIGLFSTQQLNGVNTVWEMEGEHSIGNVVINMITSRVFDGNIVVATHGNGMYSNKIYTPVSAAEKIIQSPELKLFPNPFSEQIFIEVEPKGKGPLLILIYDMNGRLIAKVAEVKSLKSKATFLWNGKNSNGQLCPPGQYLCVVRHGNSLETKKLVKL